MPIFRRRRMATKGSTPAPRKLAAKVRRLERRVALAKPEPKYVNSLESAANSSYDGALRTISGAPSQGSSDTTRVGDQLRVTRQTLSMFFNSGATSCAIRVIVFIDKRNFSTGVTDVLEAGTIGVANATNAINGLYVHDYASKYRILMDRTITFDVNGKNTGNLKKTFRFPKGLLQEFVAAGTSPVRNAIKMIYISGNAAAATPSVTWQARCNFLDA